MGAIIAVPITVTLTVLSKKPSDIIYWCKWATSYIYIELCKRQTKSRFDLYDVQVDNDPLKTGFIPPPEEVALESPLTEAQLLKTADEVFFYGVSSKSESLVIRLARRCNQEAEAWIRLQLSDGKVYHLKETSGYQQSGCDRREFTCGDLRIHYLSPMRRWRIFFNGLLREANDKDTSLEKVVHVKFAFLWRASSDPFNFISDVNTGALAVGLAETKWNCFLPPLQKLYKALDFYSQAGIIMGTIDIEEEDGREMLLFGERVRFLGDLSLQNGAEFYHMLGHTHRNGRRAHIAEVSIKNIAERLKFGYIVQPSGKVAVITDSSVDVLQNLMHEEKEENTVQTNFHAEDDLYELKGTFKDMNKFHSTKADAHFTVSCLDFKMNSVSGSGIIIKGKVEKSEKRTIPKTSLQLAPSEVTPLVVHFYDKLCQNSNLSGGKGSSLGKLTELSKDFQNFIVPEGMVITTASYEMFVTKEILKEIKNLENVLYGNTDGDVKAACQRVADQVIRSNIPDKVLQEIAANFKKAFPDEKHEKKFAVRSSATGEDTEQLSAAGQMDTFLGVTGLNEILTAVKKCWASQFSYIAVQYKRQNGQIINAPMAVVIQKMIPCDVAGVLFTCDPLTGNPATMSITANYGLGESVVSGAAEPDTIEIQKCPDEKLIIKNKLIGSKSSRIVLKDGEGTNVEALSENERQTCCLTDEMSLRLGYLAIKIEKSCKSKRDIEWGFWNNNLYIFQSRPITSGAGETEFEIDHEMDSAMHSENEYLSVCNVGEVMPGVMSTLGNEVLMKFFKIVFQKKDFVDWQLSTRAMYHEGGMNTMYGRIMFFALDLFQRINSNPESTDAGNIALFGRLIDDEEMFDIARERHFKHTKRESIKAQIRRFSRVLFQPKRRLEKSQKQYYSYRLSLEKGGTAQELFNYLLNSCTDLCEAMASHMVCSEASSIWNMIIFSVLRNAKGEIDADVYRDFSQLLTTSSEVESADVPAAMESLAFHISKDIKPEEFQKMDLNEAVRFLETSDSASGIKYREFLSKHGHRCLKEFDIRSVTWGSDPKSLIQLLQNLVGSITKDRSKKKSEDFAELISTLKIPLNFKSRLLMKLILPRSRQAVQCREASKSLLIRGVDAWRKGYAQLAKLMVSEGRIPDPDLMYFMTLEEIKELLATRSPKIISKANHRKRRYPILDKYIFPEIMKGFPRPINLDSTPRVVNDDSFSMKGIPVSQGTAKGFIRVALDLQEASLLKPGEILVTYSTDIGWSPYFPILSGVVTELGGLISHGAVVSREYGIPCIAGMHGATSQFQTGDYALLDGNKGILQKLPKPESEQIST